MRRIHYSGGEMLAADSTCKALLRYCRALANSGQGDVVSIPVVGENKPVVWAHLLIGPASEIFSTPVQTGAPDPEDAEVVHELERKTALLQPSRPSWDEEMRDVVFSGIDEF